MSSGSSKIIIKGFLNLIVSRRISEGKVAKLLIGRNELLNSEIDSLVIWWGGLREPKSNHLIFFLLELRISRGI